MSAEHQKRDDAVLSLPFQVMPFPAAQVGGNQFKSFNRCRQVSTVDGVARQDHIAQGELVPEFFGRVWLP